MMIVLLPCCFDITLGPLLFSSHYYTYVIGSDFNTQYSWPIVLSLTIGFGQFAPCSSAKESSLLVEFAPA